MGDAEFEMFSDDRSSALFVLLATLLIVSRAEDGDMTPVVSVERGDEALDVIPLGVVLARLVIRRSSCESWLQAKHLLITGLSRSQLKLVGEGEEALLGKCSRGSVGWALCVREGIFRKFGEDGRLEIAPEEEGG